MAQTVLDTDLIKQSVLLASRAPSLHNSQPWIWVGDGPELQLYLDHSRIVSHTDSSGREALISCGAVLDHLRIAVAAAGWQSSIDRFPNPNHLEHLVSVHFRRAEYTADATLLRANAILRRRTDRLPFLPPNDWPTCEFMLRQLFRSDLRTAGVRFDVVPDGLRNELAVASRLADEARRYDAEYHAELDWWTSPFDLDQGIPLHTLNSVTETDRVGINRAFPGGKPGDRRPTVGSDQAKVVMLSTPDETRSDALSCGEALSTVLLECTAAGLATCTVSHLTETESGRAAVAQLIGCSGYPQILIRIGRAPELEAVPAATPRRELAHILRLRPSNT